MDLLVVTIVTVYLAAMLAVGWLASRRIEKNDDFLVAGRRLGPVMLAGTLAATEVGGGSSLGVAEKAYGEWGLSAAWYVLTMAITFLALTLIAPRLRATGVRTVPESFRLRYGPVNGVVTAVILLLPMIGLTAIQLMASATVLTVMTGLDYGVSVLVVTVVVTIYSVMGGLWSVTLTDVVQWVLIVLGSALVIPYALDMAGGFQEVVSRLPPEKLSPTAGIGWKQIVALSVMYFASFSVGQESMQRFFAAADGRAARRGAFLAAAVYVVYAFIPAFIGVIAWTMVQSGQLDAELLSAHGPRYVLPAMASLVLPSFAVGLLFAALISATMSSADSNLLAAGSIFANDLYKIHFRRQADDAELLAVTRWVMVATSLLSLGVALLDLQDMVSLLMFSFTLRAGGVFIPYVVGHYWKRPGPAASLSAIVLGSAVVIAVERGWMGDLGFGAAVPAILVSAVAYFALTFFQKEKQDA